jgi:hypothetical protein
MTSPAVETERDDLLIRRLTKSVERQTWMRIANDLLLKRGITTNPKTAIAAFGLGLSPTEFVMLALRAERTEYE